MCLDWDMIPKLKCSLDYNTYVLWMKKEQYNEDLKEIFIGKSNNKSKLKYIRLSQKRSYNKTVDAKLLDFSTNTVLFCF